MTVQHILGLVRRCVEDYNMIEAGETVAVGVSGGKDSLLTLADEDETSRKGRRDAALSSERNADHGGNHRY